ncbi:3'(2'),5'-bisphosphate nucleotidase CysQ [Xanthobacter dioxanivorans]|uniref:3'(2'),5'-bisphosphate nucleotidase CysQ n=1 Tax=Xanthobacter dioxanivorans TaxID=2528964 RepID=A0A974PJU6_9HYPH|nr:3'(2'),5'-bisphosphate nucleotidase CysQ [Xanthobacter dioxanivorans]QRG04519.1 3'(2'),5'-bisphosphate nucleotidase CysQ [Xanthobacter dioxanivorans]
MSIEPTRPPVGAHPAPTDTLARQLAETVTEAGAMALAMFRAGVKSWTKAHDSPVTEADMAVDRFLNERLSALAPEAAWLSEESADGPARLAARRLWVVDPIDGTRAFMAGGADWAVSVALVQDGRPVLAALFAPASDELFTAVAGGGATRNGAPLHAGTRATLEGAAAAGPAADLDALSRMAEVRRLPRTRSLALRIARVATGEIDIAFSGGNSSDWDLAAADLVVHEAAARLTTREGALLRYNAPVPRHAPLICAGTTLYPAALDAARTAFKRN